MKKTVFLSVSFLFIVFISKSISLPQNGNTIIDKIKLSEDDIPKGYMYGIIPDFAKKILHANPCYMDKTAIKRLTEKIYPGGDYNEVKSIHISIIARNETPHGDDIVCYIIQYKNLTSAKSEIGKISNYLKYNRDRAILNIKDNLIVFLHVDDKNDFHYILEMDKKIKERIKNI